MSSSRWEFDETDPADTPKKTPADDFPAPPGTRPPRPFAAPSTPGPTPAPGSAAFPTPSAVPPPALPSRQDPFAASPAQRQYPAPVPQAQRQPAGPPGTRPVGGPPGARHVAPSAPSAPTPASTANLGADPTTAIPIPQATRYSVPPIVPVEPTQRPPLGTPLDAVQKVEKPRTRRLARAGSLLAAMAIGGALTGGGFYLGQNNSETVTAGSTTTPVVQSTVPTGSAPAPLAPTAEADPEVEPAAFVAEVLGPSAVQVFTNLGTGSGIIFGDRLVMTNHHVVEGSREVGVVLDDGRTIEAELVGSDPRTDIAVLELPAGLDLPVATFALGEEVKVGQTAIAIGAPFNLNKSVTAGIVSAVNRPIDNGIGINAMIQTDAPINPGNSGGALADRFGRVIGINTAIQTAGVSNSNAGVGFAVPIDNAWAVAQRIVGGESLDKGFLGVGIGSDADGEVGVILGEITAGSGADEAGLREGDRVIRINDAPVTTFQELAGLIGGGFPGDEVRVDIVRGTQALTLTAILGTQ